MKTPTTPYSEDLLVATGLSASALEQELRFWLAVKLFELRRFSPGKAKNNGQYYSLKRIGLKYQRRLNFALFACLLIFSVDNHEHIL